MEGPEDLKASGGLCGSPKARDTSASVEEESLTEDVCGICQESVQADRGRLSSCYHRFCFECIVEWAAVESTCPLCRSRFSEVTHTRVLPSGQEQIVKVRSVKWRTQAYQPDSDDDAAAIRDALGTELIGGADDFCVVCNDNGDEEHLLLCDGCDVPCHTYCCGLDAVPDGAWFCSVCRESQEVISTRATRRGRSSHSGRPMPRPVNQATSSSQIISSARRAARAAARSTARQRRSEASHLAAAVPAPAPTIPTLARGSSTQELQADAQLMRSNWGLFQSRGFRLPARTTQSRPELRDASSPVTATADVAEDAWKMAEAALRTVQTQQQGNESMQLMVQKMPARERSAALDHVRSIMRARRGVFAQGRNQQQTCARSPEPPNRGLLSGSRVPSVPLGGIGRLMAPGDCKPKKISVSCLRLAGEKSRKQAAAASTSSSGQHSLSLAPALQSPRGPSSAAELSTAFVAEAREQPASPKRVSVVSSRERHSSNAGLGTQKGRSSEAAGGAQRSRKRQRSIGGHAAGSGPYQNRLPAAAPQGSKDEAYQAVKLELKPMYKSQEITKEEYKAIAQAATRMLVSGRSHPIHTATTKGDVSNGLAEHMTWLNPELVQMTIIKAKRQVFEQQVACDR